MSGTSAQLMPQGQWNAYAGPAQSGPGAAGQAASYGNQGAGLQQQQPPWPKQPSPPPRRRARPRTLFMAAGLCFLLGILLLGFVAVIGFSGSGQAASGITNASQTPGGNSSPVATASPSSSNTSSSPTTSASPSVSSTDHPGQKYIDGARMVAGDPTHSTTQQSTTTFKVGSNMYVSFTIHPPSQGGAVCSYWYLGGNEVTSYAFNTSGASRTSYTYAIYGSPGQAYVELYWASDKTCADKLLAQHVNFTVTA